MATVTLARRIVATNNALIDPPDFSDELLHDELEAVREELACHPDNDDVTVAIAAARAVGIHPVDCDGDCQLDVVAQEQYDFALFAAREVVALADGIASSEETESSIEFRLSCLASHRLTACAIVKR